jgi:acetyl/propionyl-CoA carboxylase alpha subunit
MFKRVLIANRGEIACRVLRTLKALGIASVALYHHEDRGAPHVQLADEALQLKSGTPSAAYLDQVQIVGARGAPARMPSIRAMAFSRRTRTSPRASAPRA